VDGGVSAKDAAELIDAGANVLVAGRGVLKLKIKRLPLMPSEACAGSVAPRFSSRGLTP
jgi:pentose-5-phosphate-3-epimerase